MAVIQTGDIFKSFTFDGQDSRTYGIYITGEAVYNAPERSVEMISIPGRNGAYVLDNGRFENIEVTYPAGCFGNTEADFRDAISNIRNMLCSRKGYVRLTDDYNPNEYRLAVYKSGLEVTPAQLLAGEFNITFDCKPQRFLTSGENAVSVADGGTLSNPTLFASSPLINCNGYGTIGINGEEIKIKNVLIGVITISNRGAYYGESSCVIDLDTHYANTGDYIILPSVAVQDGDWTVDSGTITTETAAGSYCDAYYPIVRPTFVRPSIIAGEIPFLYGTSSTFTATGTFTITTSAYGALSGTLTAAIAYDSDSTITITVTRTLPSHFSANADPNSLTHGYTRLDSTKSATTNLFIDLDIGEAYRIDGTEVASVNNAVTLPAELPTLVPGSNTITYDNTVTNFKITPRWWKI